jgi:hypothetical protein
LAVRSVILVPEDSVTLEAAPAPVFGMAGLGSAARLLVAEISDQAMVSAVPLVSAPVVEAARVTWPLLPTTRTGTTLPVTTPAAAPVPTAAGLLV